MLSEQAYLQTEAAEDLKHVFDVLDKSGEGMINADSLRSAIKVHSAHTSHVKMVAWAPLHQQL